MAAPKLETIRQQYVRLWKTAEIHPEWRARLQRAAERILSFKQQYRDVEAKTGVPWFFVGILHYRESNCDFEKHLHNGDPLTAKTVRVPAGRPATGEAPFSWLESAIDALLMKKLDKVPVWDIARICFEAERFNGWGYRGPNKPNSPYLWSGTDAYTAGKYVADHVYSATAVDRQAGAIAVLKVLAELDPEVAIVERKPIGKTIKKEPVLRMGLNGIFALIAAFLATLWDWVVSMWDVALGLVQSLGAYLGLLPAAVDSASQTVGAGQTLFEQLGIGWPVRLGIAVALACLVAAFVTELQSKRTK